MLFTKKKLLAILLLSNVFYCYQFKASRSSQQHADTVQISDELVCKAVAVLDDLINQSNPDLQRLHALFKVHTTGLPRIQTVDAVMLQRLTVSSMQKRWIKDVAGKRANFGADYYLLFWGCGTSCQTGIIVNSSGTTIVQLPTAEWGYQYNANSKLLIENPPDGSTSRPDWASPVLHYWTGAEFEILDPASCGK